jgi:hypothetical protein
MIFLSSQYFQGFKGFFVNKNLFLKMKKIGIFMDSVFAGVGKGFTNYLLIIY